MSHVFLFALTGCYPEHIHCTQGKIREGPVSMGGEMLRRAQQDSTALLSATSCHPSGV